MKIAVVGLWHLGCVTAACLAKAGFDVIAYDADQAVINHLNQGKAPLFEPELDELLAHGIASGKLTGIFHPEMLNQADIVWINYDTPVDENDVADVKSVTDEVKKLFPHFKSNTLMIISSQLPVGSTRKLQQYCKEHFPEKEITFAYSPENLRLGKAISVFMQPGRVVVGLQSEQDKIRVQTVLQPFTNHIVWMSLESAEMTKHALNAFLATSVVFINELATLCEKVGADAREVEQGLKTEERIGAKAYLKPGNAIAGGTLARDVNFLMQIGEENKQKTPLFSALLESNQAHKYWSSQRLLDVFSDLKGRVIVALGLTYKAGTDTLRRSTAVELCVWLKAQGAKVMAYDPAVKTLPDSLATIIDLKTSLVEAITGADALVVATEWPQFLSLMPDQIADLTTAPHIFDANGFLMKSLGHDKRIRYHSVGKTA
ncbi:MAG: hypothetical protein ACD_46C00195G0007 [uncultured bacterium]|nr:MAG: hypothetical protein ACD_46C00195G0007 [uncultured bacterium]